MIEEVKLWGCRCDKCGEEFYDDNITAWNVKDDLKFLLNESGWREVDGKWYCPDCFYELFEEDEDGNITLKKELRHEV